MTYVLWVRIQVRCFRNTRLVESRLHHRWLSLQSSFMGDGATQTHAAHSKQRVYAGNAERGLAKLSVLKKTHTRQNSFPPRWRSAGPVVDHLPNAVDVSPHLTRSGELFCDTEQLAMLFPLAIRVGSAGFDERSIEMYRRCPPSLDRLATKSIAEKCHSKEEVQQSRSIQKAINAYQTISGHRQDSAGMATYA